MNDPNDSNDPNEYWLGDPTIQRIAIDEKFFCVRITNHLIFRCNVDTFSDAARAGRRRAARWS